MAISSKINDGRGAQFFIRNRSWTRRESDICSNRQAKWQGGKCQESQKMGKAFDFRSAYNDSPQVLENIPPVRITFPDGTNIMSDFGDIDHSLSKTFDREVRLMKASSWKNLYMKSIDQI